MWLFLLQKYSHIIAWTTSHYPTIRPHAENSWIISDGFRMKREKKCYNIIYEALSQLLHVTPIFMPQPQPCRPLCAHSASSCYKAAPGLPAAWANRTHPYRLVSPPLRFQVSCHSLEETFFHLRITSILLYTFMALCSPPSCYLMKLWSYFVYTINIFLSY